MEKLLREKLKNGKFDGVSLSRSRIMGAVKGKGNKSTELKFCLGLANAGIVGWKMHEKLIGNPDIIFPSYKVVIFLDGCFWHGCPMCGHIPKENRSYWKAKIERNSERDTYKAAALTDLGYLVIRFWEHELSNDLNRCIEIVKENIEENLIRMSSVLDVELDHSEASLECMIDL